MRLTELRRNPAFRVVVLGDGGSFSSGLLAITDMKATVIPEEAAALVPPGAAPLAATFIGEPTGGRPGAYGEVLGTALPASGLYFQYSTKLHAVPSWIPDRDAVYPDIPVVVRASDYFARHDAVLAAALANVSEAPIRSTGDFEVVNGASLRPDEAVGPGSMAAAIGTFPGSAGEVWVDGARAEVISWAEGRVDFAIPANAKTGPAEVQLRAADTILGRATVHQRAAGPGLFVGQALNAAPDSVLTFSATGVGDSPAAWMGETQVEVLDSSPEAPGRRTVRIRVPADVRGVYPLFIAAEGSVSNGVSAAVR